MPDPRINLANPDFGTRNYAAAGLPANPPPGGSSAANPSLGSRNQAGLQRAFSSSPLYGTQGYTIEAAGEIFARYAGENSDFAMYRRNFVPEGDSRAEYVDVRTKDGVNIQAAKLGTAFSPTVASPGAGNGFDYNALGAGENYRGLVPARAGETAINPIDSSYQNLDSRTEITNIGRVRTFSLGIGSKVGYLRVNPSNGG